MGGKICADKGTPLAILTSDGKLYIPTSPAMPGDGQNGRLKEFAEQQVTVTGTVFPARGANAIQIASIERKSRPTGPPWRFPDLPQGRPHGRAGPGSPRRG